MDEGQLIIRPETSAIALMDGENAAKLSLHDQRIVDRRLNLEFLRLRTNIFAQCCGLLLEVLSVSDNQWFVGTGKFARDGIVVVNVHVLDAFNTVSEILVLEWRTHAFAVQQK